MYLLLRTICIVAFTVFTYQTIAQCDFTITSNASGNGCYILVEEVVWTSQNNTLFTTDSLSKVNGGNSWNADAVSTATVKNNGFTEFIATETNRRRMLGLNNGNTNSHWNTIDYAFYLNTGGNLEIRESGSGNRISGGTYSTNDTLRIAVEENVIKYYKNGSLLYISSATPTLPLLVDNSFYDPAGTLSKVVIGNVSDGSLQATVASPGPGTEPSYQWKVNGLSVGSDTSVYTDVSLVEGDTITCDLTLGADACNEGTITSNKVWVQIAQDLGFVDFYIEGSVASFACKTVEEEVAWQATALENVEATANNLTKIQSNNSWNGGAASWNTVSDNGYLQFIASETNKRRRVGLSTSNTGANHNSIQYSFYLNTGGNLEIRESGSGNRISGGSYTSGDTFKIAVENNEVKYYQNGNLLYISGNTPTLPLLVDVSIYDVGGTVTEALVSNYSTGTFTATATNAGSSPMYTWQINGITQQSGLLNMYTNTSILDGDVVSCILSPDLSGCSSTTYTSNDITNREVVEDNSSIDFHIEGSVASFACKKVEEEVAWQATALENVEATANNLTKIQSNNSWNGGAASWNTVSDNGYFQFIASETNKRRRVGLSTSNTGANHNSIQYSFYLNTGGNLEIRESGSGNRISGGSYTSGDTLKIAVENNEVKYYQNGNLLYISGNTPTLPLLVDVSIYDVGGTVTEALVSNYSTGTFTATATNAGSSPTYTWQVNGVTQQSGLSDTYNNSSLVDGDVVSCILSPDLSGCSSTTYTSNGITNREVVEDNSSIDFHIEGSVASFACNTVEEEVAWQATALENVEATANNLTKIQSNNSWNGGAASWNTVSDNGYLQFIASETNKRRRVGLSTSNTGANQNSIQYSFYLNTGGNLEIRESGSGNRISGGSYTSGDTFKIAVENNEVKYYQNGNLLYISGNAPTLPLLVDVSIYDVGGTVTEALVSNYNTGTFTATATNAGSSPTYTWQINGITQQSGLLNMYTNTSILDGDVVSCILSPDLSGCSSTTYTSNGITNREVVEDNSSIDFHIEGSVASFACNTVEEEVAWQATALENVEATANNLTKIQSNNSWNGGAASWNTVSDNGYLQFIASETNKRRRVGLSTSNTGSNHNSIQYSFYLNTGGNLEIRESGSGNRISGGSYTSGDTFKIAVENNEVKYYQNGNLLYISGNTPTLPLLVDVSIYDVGGTVTEALVSNYSTGTFTATATNAGSSPTYTWQVNGVTQQSGLSDTYNNSSLVDGDVVSCILSPDLSGCSSTTYTSNGITNREVVEDNSSIDFHIEGSVASFACNTVEEEVAWQATALENVEATANNLTKIQSNNSWNGGAASWNTVSDNGYLQFIASETNKRRRVGLSTSNTGANQNSIQYSFYLNTGGNLEIRESGSGNRISGGSYTSGDTFKIAVENNEVKYYQNGNLLYISGNTPTLPLLVDVSIYDVGGTVTEALVSNYSTGTFTATATNAGASPTYTWQVNGVTQQSGLSDTYNNSSLVDGDVVSCILSPDLSGCSSTTYTSNGITNREVVEDNSSIDFYIEGSAAGVACNTVEEEVAWQATALENVEATANNLTKIQSNNSWNGGAASWNTVSDNGYLQFIASETNKRRRVGLSTSNTGANHNSIQYSFYLNTGGNLEIRESGSGNRISGGSYTSGDTLKIAVENNEVKYYQNGNLLYISGNTPTLPLLVDVSIYDVGGTVTEALVSNYSTGTFTATAINAGTDPIYTWQVNGITQQSGLSDTYTNTSISRTDVITCLLSPDIAGCNSTDYLSNAIYYIDPGRTVTWNGSVSSDWNNPLNWSDGFIPDRLTSISIPPGTTHDLVLDTSVSIYNLTIESGANFTISGTDTLNIYRSYTNDGGTFIANNSTVSFQSCYLSNLLSSTGTESFYNLEINNSSGLIITDGNHEVDNNLNLANGIITQQATLALNDNATVSGASDNSFVDGSIIKIGDEAFVFPTGTKNRYRPIAISAPASATDALSAQYFEQNPHPSYDRSSIDPDIDHVSGCEYWELNAINGAPSVQVTLSWNTNSCGVDSLPDLTVAGWNGLQWVDYGNAGTTGNTTAGTITGMTTANTFGPFTLASVSPKNPLPVDWSYFEVTLKNEIVDIHWQTEVEIDNDYFTVERSKDGLSWEAIARVQSAGSSYSTRFYHVYDNQPFAGISYYRIQQTDFNGQYSYSEIRAITVKRPVTSLLSIYPNPAYNRITIEKREAETFELNIYNLQGVEVTGKVNRIMENRTKLVLDLSELTPGLYTVIYNASINRVYKH